VNIDADELLARIRRDYPTQYQLCQQQLIIELQYDEIQRLKTELTATRDVPAPAEETPPIGDPPLYGQPMQSYHLRAAPVPESDDDHR
jgi:hypothetical protein